MERGTVKRKEKRTCMRLERRQESAAVVVLAAAARLSYLSPVFQCVYTDLAAASTAAAAAAAAAVAAATTTGVIYI